MSPTLLSPLEAAAGLVLGVERSAPDANATPATPRDALERALLPALERPPCLVSFSGGRDSSAVLAVAASVARREGLDDPVPATARFPGAVQAAESSWQEQVVSELGLADWLRIEVGDELDCVGPVATDVLRRHGLLWPANVHFHVPLLEQAAGGSLLTGVGGDEVFGPSRWQRAATVLARRVRPGPRDVLRLGLALSPPPVRRAVYRRRPALPFPWLREPAREAVTAALARDAAAEPFRWGVRLRWWRQQRYVRVGIVSLALLAEDADVRIAHPLAEPAFSEALARLPDRDRYLDRTAAMRLLFADLLPDELLARVGKARFGRIAWGPHSRALTDRWDGRGVDPDLVDVDALRRAWPSAERDGRLLTVIQSVRLAELRGGKV